MVQYQHTMNTTEQRIARALHRAMSRYPETLAAEMWKVSTGNGTQTLDYEARVTHSEAVLQFDRYGVKCELVWQEGELTVARSPFIDGERVYQDEMQLADTNTAGALGEIVAQAHKATEEHVKGANADLRAEHAELVSNYQGAN